MQYRGGGDGFREPLLVDVLFTHAHSWAYHNFNQTNGTVMRSAFLISVESSNDLTLLSMGVFFTPTKSKNN